MEPERRHPIEPLEPEEIQLVLDTALPGVSLREAVLLEGGFSNTNYRLFLRGRRTSLVLRLHSGGAAVCAREVALCALARSHGIPAPEVLYSDPEGTVCGLPLLLARFVDGIPLRDLLLLEDDAVDASPAVGALLARLASISFPRAGLFGKDLAIVEPFDDMAETLASFVHRCLFEGRAAERLGAETTARLWRLVEENKPLVRHLPPALVHSDFNGKNVLMRLRPRGWEVAALLDWEFAHAGAALADLGNLLRYDRSLPAGFEEGVLAAYREAGASLPWGWRRTTRLLDLTSQCEFLDLPGEHPQRWALARACIEDTLERWASLEDG